LLLLFYAGGFSYAVRECRIAGLLLRVLVVKEPYDAFLLVSFGGPEGMEDVMPFLHKVLRGRNVPIERMQQVAHHYELFDGVSPINQQNRDLIERLREEFSGAAIDLPVYWGNRNWHPMLEDTVRQMAADGVKRALAFVTSAFSSYSGCRQYLEDIERARLAVGDGAPAIEKLRGFHNHPGFIEPCADNVKAALQQLPAAERERAAVAFTAHSIPVAMAQTCLYEKQLQDACALVMEKVGHNPMRLVYQSRSGPPSQPWLEPDICDHLKSLREAEGVRNVVLMPIGFISDHMEVKFDLDTEAQQLAQELGLTLVRAATVGVDPRFVTMIRNLVEERIAHDHQRVALGCMGASPDTCAPDCCAYSPAAARPSASKEK
ncbi:MAG TPA: ferrochelatase, partial [Trichormus sp.]